MALLDDLTPTLCQQIWDALPFSTVQGHALITGEMLFATTPVSSLVRENVTLFTDMGIGGCFYGNGSQNLGIIYGPVTEPEGHSVWGRVVDEDHEILKRVGRAVWENLMLPYGQPTDGKRLKRKIVLECVAR